MFFEKNVIFKQSMEASLMKLYIEDLERGFLGLEREEIVKSLDNYKVSLDITILDALKVINEGVGNIALVVDGDQKLVGTVTDGDVRRGLLSGLDAQSPVSMIMKVDPVVAKLGDDRQLILSIMKQNALRHMPIVDLLGVYCDWNTN